MGRVQSNVRRYLRVGFLEEEEEKNLLVTIALTV
jgi:hypothetical protein